MTTFYGMSPWSPRTRAALRASRAGVTLVELLAVVAIVGMVMTSVLMGTGTIGNANLRGAATMISGAIRVAYTRASATSRPNRLVFDFDERSIWLEETTGEMTLDMGKASGGAEAATQAEKDAVGQAERILKGPEKARAGFTEVQAFGMGEGGGKRVFGAGVKYRAVYTGHTPDGQTDGRAYLFFWPGGQTERASIQLVRGSDTGKDDGLSIVVAPLTGKVKIESGQKAMAALRDDGTASEREDTGF
jgi:general secretion pathway protein H